MDRTAHAAACLAAHVLFATGSSAPAAEFPARPVRLVAASPGTLGDIVARILAPYLNIRWQQPVIVQNRSGAGGTLAAALVAKAGTDGHTMLMSDMTQLVVASHLYANLAYDPARAFAPVALIARAPSVLSTYPDAPWADLHQLIAYARTHPRRVIFSSGSIGTPGHLTCVLFGMLAGIEVAHVPFKGGPAALLAVLGRQVHFTSNSVAVAAPHVAGKRLVALVLAGDHRSRVLPDVPTSGELGMPGLLSSAWVGVSAPAATPPELIQQWKDALREAVGDSAVRAQLDRHGSDLPGESAGQFAAFLIDERARWERVIAAAELKPE